MMRSLYSGVAGLRTHQTKMDVIGNNIANVNTVGFKSSQVLFKDVLYQTTQSATGATANSGGTNAKQIGLGTTVATISVSHQPGSSQSTNNPYDLMINGSSFFIVNRDGTNYFTKVGAFKKDDAGNLVTGNGELVMGWQVDPSDPNAIKRDTVSALRPGSLEFQTAAPELTSKLHLDGNITSTDPKLLSADGVVATVSIYDNLGYPYEVKFKITQDTNDTSLYNLSVVSVKDANNVDISQNGTNAYNVTLQYTTVKFNKSNGSFESVGGRAGNKTTMLTIAPNGTNGNVFRDPNATPPVTGIELDCSSLTMYSEVGGECDIEAIRGGTDKDKSGAGRTVGTLDDINIDTNGKLYGVYSNGVSRLLGQIAVANFVNPAGLEAIGNSLYKETKASGDFDGIGKDITSVGETMTQGVIEMSNVDLSQEFTEMIVTQRGFQANSRIITVSDTLIEELVNLKR
ncbi:MAG: flagellar hook-basal body complex protein [Bacteroidales bacterium]|nr:flagellar hook-basal body complex protein [Clostridium sp.]MCM1202729.1 flagellar hook-basal body complex protein [Bacteroidales bacterium]